MIILHVSTFCYMFYCKLCCLYKIIMDVISPFLIGIPFSGFWNTLFASLSWVRGMLCLCDNLNKFQFLFLHQITCLNAALLFCISFLSTKLNSNNYTVDKGSEKSSCQLSAYKWAEVYRGLRTFLRPFGDSGEGRLDFYHRSLSKAVRIKCV